MIIGVVGILCELLTIGILTSNHGSLEDPNVKSFIAWGTIVNLIYIITDALLVIIGAALKRRFYLMPWIIAHIILNTLQWLAVLLSLITLVLTLNLKDGRVTDLLLTLLFFLVIGAVVSTFFIMTVVDHFMELREEEQRGQFQPNPHRTYGYGHLIQHPNQYPSYPTQFFAYPIPPATPANFDASKMP